MPRSLSPMLLLVLAVQAQASDGAEDKAKGAPDAKSQARPHPHPHAATSEPAKRAAMDSKRQSRCSPPQRHPSAARSQAVPKQQRLTTRR
ncbi:hypothetical protein HYH03_014619 [Edaphochlamys debaryana]|uniref:Uncharacterized protein n=1 Tax=Edaphochlamys debaryana TaxID=47281 RepID=A0A835XNF8_9CHLO|nr:hypothetical protein HYH03_014619 [Edaphochlamys debaryana]|eukprot:KAG2486690.1 hypothetical protein HYH03_014619 [Edaphochlamys debaryana]